MERPLRRPLAFGWERTLPPLVRADLHGLHPGFSCGARLEHLAVADNDSGCGSRLLVHDGAFLRGGLLHDIKLRLSVGSACHDYCGCSRNKKLLHDVSSIVSVSLRRFRAAWSRLRSWELRLWDPLTSIPGWRP